MRRALIVFSMSLIIVAGNGAFGIGPTAVLDNSYPASGTMRDTVSAKRGWAQTFTVGTTGTLDSVSLALYSTKPTNSEYFVLEIRSLNNGYPDDANGVLAVAHFPLSVLPQWYLNIDQMTNFNLSHFQVHANKGDRFAIVVSCGDKGTFQKIVVLMGNSSPYNESHFYTNYYTWFSTGKPYSLFFQTYMIPTEDESENTSITFMHLDITTTLGGAILSPAIGRSYHEKGTHVSLVATPRSDDAAFLGWTGTAVVAGKVADPLSPATSVYMDNDYSIRANFKRPLVLAPELVFKGTQTIPVGTAILTGTIVMNYGFPCEYRYGLQGNHEIFYTDWEGNVSVGEDFNAIIHGLTEGTAYWAWPQARTPLGMGEGMPLQFSTPGQPTLTVTLAP